LPSGKEGGYTEITFLTDVGKLKISVRETLPPNYLKIGQQNITMPPAHEPIPDTD
jgi:hypothetical protein